MKAGKLLMYEGRRYAKKRNLYLEKLQAGGDAELGDAIVTVRATSGSIVQPCICRYRWRTNCRPADGK